MNYKQLINCVILKGNLANVKIRCNQQTGAQFATAGLATHLTVTHADKTYQSQDWHTLVLSERLVHQAQAFLQSGNFVRVVGRLRTRSVKDAQTGYVCHAAQIDVRRIELLHRKGDAAAVSESTAPLPTDSASTSRV